MLVPLVQVRRVTGFGDQPTHCTLYTRVVFYMVGLDMLVNISLIFRRFPANSTEPIFILSLFHQRDNPCIQVGYKI